jgi:hypothetical protein
LAQTGHTIGVSDADDFTFDLICHRCGCALKSGEGSFYIVHIEAFADPSPPVVDETTSTPGPGHLEALLEEMRHLSEQELMDQVYRRLTLSLCGACYARWIEDPTGSC